MRRAARKDDNHNSIADIFIAAGATVADTSQLGGGFPDMVVGMYGFNVLVEVKDGEKAPSKQKLTSKEFEFFDNWKGWVAVVRNDQDALNIINQLRQAKAYELRGFTASSPGQLFAKDCLDPEKYGFSVSAKVRDAAREVLGMKTKEK